MLTTVRQSMNTMAIAADREALDSVIEAIADRLSSQPLITSGIAIKTGGSTLAKTGAADFYATADGVIVKIAASTDLTALTGLVITASSFNVACFYIDSLAVVSVVFGTEGTTAALVKWPQPPRKKALVGTLLITHSATFTGGTTALDTATTVYLPGIAAFDPTIRLGS